MALHVTRINLAPPGPTGELLLSDTETGSEVLFEVSPIDTAPGWRVRPTDGMMASGHWVEFQAHADRIIAMLWHPELTPSIKPAKRKPFLMSVVGRLLLRDDVATAVFSADDPGSSPVFVHIRRTDRLDGYEIVDARTGSPYDVTDDDLAREMHRVAHLIVKRAGPFESALRYPAEMNDNTAKPVGLNQPSPVALIDFTLTIDSLHLLAFFEYSDPSLGHWIARRQINVAENADGTGWRASPAGSETHLPNSEPFLDDALALVRELIGDRPRGLG